MVIKREEERKARKRERLDEVVLVVRNFTILIKSKKKVKIPKFFYGTNELKRDRQRKTGEVNGKKWFPHLRMVFFIGQMHSLY